MMFGFGIVRVISYGPMWWRIFMVDGVIVDATPELGGWRLEVAWAPR